MLGTAYYGNVLKSKATSESEPHWGPRIDKIPIKGFFGLLISIGVLISGLAALPAARLWLYISLPLGVIFGLVLHYLHRD